MSGNTNPALTDLILTHNVEKQCSNLANWLKQHYNLDVIGFFLKDDRMSRAHFFVQNNPVNMARKVKALLAENSFSDNIHQEILLQVY